MIKQACKRVSIPCAGFTGGVIGNLAFTIWRYRRTAALIEHLGLSPDIPLSTIILMHLGIIVGVWALAVLVCMLVEVIKQKR